MPVLANSKQAAIEVNRRLQLINCVFMQVKLNVNNTDQISSNAASYHRNAWPGKLVCAYCIVNKICDFVLSQESNNIRIRYFSYSNQLLQTVLF